MEGIEKEKISRKIGFIGGGVMATSIFNGIVSKGLVCPDQVIVSGPSLESMLHFQEKGASITTSNGKVVDSSEIIFLSVKPQVLHTVSQQIANEAKDKLDNKLFISILAGTCISKIENCFSSPINLVRVMPNTAVAVGEGCNVFSPNCRVNTDDLNVVKSLLRATGICHQVPESQIDAITTVSGSGPAYMYLIIEALADGGVKMGIPRAEAITFATQTMLGSAKMVQCSGKHSAQLKDDVCSAGGTTIAAMHALEKGGVRGAIMDAVEAAFKRAIEMGQSDPADSQQPIASSQHPVRPSQQHAITAEQSPPSTLPKKCICMAKK